MIQDNKDVIRVVLEGDSKTAYDKMNETLKSENHHIKFTPSRLVACLVRRYFSLYFEQDKTQIANEFFDSKEHLKEAIKTARSPEELERALNKALERIKDGLGEMQPLRKKRGRKSKMISSTDSSPTEEDRKELEEKSNGLPA